MTHLISRDERISKRIDGSLYYYRRLPATRRAALIRKCKKRGIVDYDKLGWEAYQWGLLGWAEVTGDGPDGEKIEVAFDRELTPYVPEDTRNELGRLIMGGSLDEDFIPGVDDEEEDGADEDPTRTSGSTSELS